MFYREIIEPLITNNADKVSDFSELEAIIKAGLTPDLALEWFTSDETGCSLKVNTIMKTFDEVKVTIVDGKVTAFDWDYEYIPQWKILHPLSNKSD